MPVLVSAAGTHEETTQIRALEEIAELDGDTESQVFRLTRFQAAQIARRALVVAPAPAPLDRETLEIAAAMLYSLLAPASGVPEIYHCHIRESAALLRRLADALSRETLARALFETEDDDYPPTPWIGGGEEMEDVRTFWRRRAAAVLAALRGPQTKGPTA